MRPPKRQVNEHLHRIVESYASFMFMFRMISVRTNTNKRAFSVKHYNVRRQASMRVYQNALFHNSREKTARHW